MLLRIGHKPRGGFPLPAACPGKPVQISIDAAGPCGGGVAARAQHDADKTMVTLLELRKR